MNIARIIFSPMSMFTDRKNRKRTEMKKRMAFHFKGKIINGILLAGLPVLALICLEYYTHVPGDLTVPIFLLNLAFYYLLFALCSFIAGSTSVGYGVAPFFPMLFGLINYFVVDFRSSPILPWDIYSIKTAASVAGNYEFVLTSRLVLVVLGFLLIALLGSRTGIRFGKKSRLAGFVLTICCSFGYISGIGTDRAVEIFGLNTTLFTPNVLYRNNGLTAGFLANLKYLNVEKPAGYSEKKALEIASSVQEEKQMPVTKEELPNVIVIMNEAFSDLSVLGDFETDYDYMPFIRSLKENTVKGNCYVSVKGGNTANSEYEFLTGDSMAFLPAGSVPYQQYIKGEMPSLATALADLGYETAAIHPYNASGWNRDKVYPWLGFEKSLFKTDFKDPEKIRGYISDYAAFSKIIDLFEEKEEGQRLFTFEVTMQNHGGYSKDTDDFEEMIHLTQKEEKTTQVRAVEKYLTLMLETDRAFEMLISYLQKLEEPTVVLMFGDHQPSDYITNPILRLAGRDRDGEEADEVLFDNHIVPFVMWANYDIEEEEISAISVNYLGGLLFEKAGIPTTAYQKFLSGLREEIPAVTADMLMDKDGNRLRLAESGWEEIQKMADYHILDYNHLADAKHRIENFYD